MAVTDDFRDLVRLKVGDSDGTLLSDDQIDALIGSTTSPNLAAADCADALAARFSRSVSFSVEGLSISNSQKAANYAALAQRLRAQAVVTDSGGLGAPLVSGVSVSEQQSVASDTDREPSRFSVGMTDFPGVEGA